MSPSDAANLPPGPPLVAMHPPRPQAANATHAHAARMMFLPALACASGDDHRKAEATPEARAVCVKPRKSKAAGGGARRVHARAASVRAPGLGPPRSTRTDRRRSHAFSSSDAGRSDSEGPECAPPLSGYPWQREPSLAASVCSAFWAYKLSFGSTFVTLQLGNQPIQRAPSLSKQSFSRFTQFVKNWILCHRTATY